MADDTGVEAADAAAGPDLKVIDGGTGGSGSEPPAPRDFSPAERDAITNYADARGLAIDKVTLEEVKESADLSWSRNAARSQAARLNTAHALG